MLSVTKLKELLHKNAAEEEKKKTLLWVLAIIGAVVAVAIIAYAVYRYFTPDYLEDFEEEYTDGAEEEL